MHQDAAPLGPRAPSHLGVRALDGGLSAAVVSRNGSALWLCLFDPSSGAETARWRLATRDGDVFHGFIPGAGVGALYGLRADGPDDLAHGHRFDPAKLLIDPYATRLDRHLVYQQELGAPRASAIDTAPFLARAVVEAEMPDAPQAPRGREPAFIYEMCPRAYTMRHPDVEPALRGTLDALASPAVIDHLVKLGVSHVELMPTAAWLDERHLVALGLSNAWGYNSAAFMALDPRLAPNGLASLRKAVDALRAVGIGVLLDVVFNHSAESDDDGPTVSLRGLDNALYYRHAANDPGRLVNDSGCGNTLACERPHVLRLFMDVMRYFVAKGGVEGFRFDLAPVLGRDAEGFSPEAPLLAAMAQDPLLRDVMLIAEPWDIGPGGYQLGRFQAPWREWSDRYRDDVRRFWRGGAGAIGALATRLAGSQDIFAATGRRPGASVNLVATHDGFALRDVVSYETKRNQDNGEFNRDGTNENFSWNWGVEGDSDDPAVRAARLRDIRALLATLFLSRGAPMVTAGDEFNRTQRGNNNAYAQDNETTWIDWENVDHELCAFVGSLAALRATLTSPRADRFLTGAPIGAAPFPDVRWLDAQARDLDAAHWRDGDFLGMASCEPVDGATPAWERIYVAFNRARVECAFTLPATREGWTWRKALDSASPQADAAPSPSPSPSPSTMTANARTVLVFVETTRA